MKLSCPNCQTEILFPPEETRGDVMCPKCATVVSPAALLSMDGPDTLDQTLARSDHDQLGPGDELSHFRLTKVLGEGGFGTVYEAHDTRLDRNVALKVPKSRILTERQANTFIREAQSAAQLKDANIVSVFEVGRDRGRIFIVSELIQGVTLSNWRRNTRPTPRQSAAMVAKLARSLHRAHQAGVIHRDMKPGNVLIDEEGQPQITDFGLAKREGPGEHTISIKGAMIGTPAYMSPEQASGMGDLADCRTDVYALGVIFYELLTDRRPFAGNSDIIFNEIKEGAYEKPIVIRPGLPLDAQAICETAMATKPGDRYQNALQLAEDLERFVRREPTSVRQLSSMERTGLLLARHRISATIALLLAVIGVLSYFIFSAPDQSNAESSKAVNPGKSDISMMTVEFDVQPPPSEVYLVRLDENFGTLDYENILRPEPVSTAASDSNRTRWKANLESGMYLIEVVTDNGVMEVYRNVPFELNEVSFTWKMLDWNAIDESKRLIELQPIVVPLAEKTPQSGVVQLGDQRLARVSAGTFLTGNNQIKNQIGKRFPARIPEQEIPMNAFYLGQFEVSASSYYDVMGMLPAGLETRLDQLQPGQVLTHVEWAEAVEYCERIGARLPTFDEYLFAATNKGTTTFPWGNDAKPQLTQIGSIGQPDEDKTFMQPEVYNLYSSVGEWAWEINMPYADRKAAPNPADTKISPLLSNSRVVLGLIDRDEATRLKSTPRDFYDNRADSNRTHNGFRIARSLQSRLKPYWLKMQGAQSNEN